MTSEAMNRHLSIESCMDIFGVCRSHIYRMLREGELAYSDDRRPAKVTKQSVLSAIKNRLPFFEGHEEALADIITAVEDKKQHKEFIR